MRDDSTVINIVCHVLFLESWVKILHLQRRTKMKKTLMCLFKSRREVVDNAEVADIIAITKAANLAAHKKPNAKEKSRF